MLSKETFCKLAKDQRIRLYAPMSKLNNVFGICYRSSSDKEKIVECTVEPYTIFKIEEGYKVTLKAVNEEYGSDNYYVSDLLSLIREGRIKAVIH